MLKSSIKTTMVFAAIAACALAAAPIAQAQSAPASTCPARYEPMDGLCFNKTSGDIVQAEASGLAPERQREAPAAARILTDANCQAGYAILLNSLCFSRTTGDIVLADDTPSATIQAASK